MPGGTQPGKSGAVHRLVRIQPSYRIHASSASHWLGKSTWRKANEPGRPLAFHHEWLGFNNKRGPSCVCRAAETPENAQSLNRYGFREISRLIDIGALLQRNVISQQLQG